MSTEHLILRFYSDLVKHQQDEAKEEKQFGELVVSVGYIKESSVVEVNVIQGENMGKHIILCMYILIIVIESITVCITFMYP